MHLIGDVADEIPIELAVAPHQDELPDAADEVAARGTTVELIQQQHQFELHRSGVAMPSPENVVSSTPSGVRRTSAISSLPPEITIEPSVSIASPPT